MGRMVGGGSGLFTQFYGPNFSPSPLQCLIRPFVSILSVSEERGRAALRLDVNGISLAKEKAKC